MRNVILPDDARIHEITVCLHHVPVTRIISHLHFDLWLKGLAFLSRHVSRGRKERSVPLRYSISEQRELFGQADDINHRFTRCWEVHRYFFAPRRESLTWNLSQRNRESKHYNSRTIIQLKEVFRLKFLSSGLTK